MKEYRSHAHSVSSCKYHFVWCPKSSKAKLCVPRGISDPAQYRHSVLDVVENAVRELYGETADHFSHEILALEIENPRPVLSPAPEARTPLEEGPRGGTDTATRRRPLRRRR